MSSPDWAAWAVSIVNGIVGDHLHETRNGLAIDMAFYAHGQPLPLMPASLYQAHPQLSPKLCILVHGFACNEGVWSFHPAGQPDAETSYGALLQRDLGFTPFYLRYNTGLPLAQNGLRLDALLDELVAAYPVPIEEIVFIGHSMGGLIVRSACHYGDRRQAAWVRRVRRVFYLGTPHDGVALVQAGHAATTVLHIVPNSVTHLIGDILDTFSQGVKDLKQSRPLVAPEEQPDGAAASSDQELVPWLASAEHYLVAGTITADPGHPAARILGDGLVGVSSSHSSAKVGIPGEAKLFPGRSHLQLCHNPEVYEQIRAWCSNTRDGGGS